MGAGDHLPEEVLHDADLTMPPAPDPEGRTGGPSGP